MPALTEKAVNPGGVDSLAGFVASDAFGTGGDRFFGDEGTFLIVKNGSGASITYTIVDSTSVAPPGSSSFTANVAVTVPASGQRVIGPFNTARFSQADGLGVFGFPSAATSITVQAFQL